MAATIEARQHTYCLHGCVQVETFRPTRPLLSGDAPRSHAGDPEAAGPPIDLGSYSFLNIKRYRQYFNVDTWVRARRPARCRLVVVLVLLPLIPDPQSWQGELHQ